MKKKLLIGSCVFLIVFITSVYLGPDYLLRQRMFGTIWSESDPSDDQADKTVAQVFVRPGFTSATESIKIVDDETALDIVRRTHGIETKRYDFGDVVTSIDQVDGGIDGRYWILYINGEMSSVGAGEYKVKSGDRILWSYQKEGETP